MKKKLDIALETFWLVNRRWFNVWTLNEPYFEITNQILDVESTNNFDIEELKKIIHCKDKGFWHYLTLTLNNEFYYPLTLSSYSWLARIIFKNDFYAGIIKPSVFYYDGMYYDSVEEYNSLFESFTYQTQDEKRWTLLADCYLFVKIYQINMFYNKNFEMLILVMAQILQQHKMLSMLSILIKNFIKYKNHKLLKHTKFNIYFTALRKNAESDEEKQINLEMLKLIRDLIKE